MYPDDVNEFNVFASDCPSRGVLEMVADKWSVLVVHALLGGTKRHHELMDDIGGVSQKMLTQTLRELEHSGLVERVVHAEVPPRVEYTLTPLGRTLGGPMKQLAAWAQTHAGELLAAQQAHQAHQGLQDLQAR